MVLECVLTNQALYQSMGIDSQAQTAIEAQHSLAVCAFVVSFMNTCQCQTLFRICQGLPLHHTPIVS